MTTAAHQLLDHLLDDLKKELFEKMHQNIVLELEKQKRNLQNMVAEMLTERKGEMLVVMMNKVHREIMKEQEKIMKEQEKIMNIPHISHQRRQRRWWKIFSSEGNFLTVNAKSTHKRSSSTPV